MTPLSTTTTSSYLRRVPLLLFALLLFSFTLSDNRVKVEQNTNENVLMITIEGTTSGNGSYQILDKNKKVILKREYRRDNERTIFYLDLNQEKIAQGQYSIEIIDLKLSADFAIK